jgi:hypothetical protein
MTRSSRLRAFAVMAVVALVAAVPALASGTGHGNKCGKGHAKHSKAVGKTCAKKKAHTAAVIRQARREHESPATVVAEDQAGTTDSADREDANDAAENEQGEDANDQGDDATDNDQGEDANDQGDDASENDQADAPETETADNSGG